MTELPHAKGKYSVLLVEDEHLLIWILEDALLESGHEVFTADTGNTGLAALESGGGYDALITNIRLADGPDGWALARRAREIDPRIAVLYVSGDSSSQHRTEGVPGSDMVAKPLKPDDFNAALDRLLARRSEPAD